MPRLARLTRRRAQAHEALVVRLDALVEQVRPQATRHPGQPVSPLLADIARQCLADLAWFERKPCATLAPDWAGLLAQLGQGRAMLDTFEALNSQWDGKRNARVWVLRHGTAPIARLRPLITVSPEARKASSDLRRELERRINAITKGLPTK